MVGSEVPLPGVLMEAVERVADSFLGDQRHLKIFLFGSRATGRGGARSDFDLGIEGDAPIPARVLDSVREEFERLPILQRVDVVDFGAVDDPFREIATRDRIPLYER